MKLTGIFSGNRWELASLLNFLKAGFRLARTIGASSSSSSPSSAALRRGSGKFVVYFHAAPLGHFGDVSSALAELLEVRKYERVRLKVTKLWNNVTMSTLNGDKAVTQARRKTNDINRYKSVVGCQYEITRNSSFAGQAASDGAPKVDDVAKFEKQCTDEPTPVVLSQSDSLAMEVDMFLFYFSALGSFSNSASRADACGSSFAALNPCFNVSGVDYLIENISRDLEFADDGFATSHQTQSTTAEGSSSQKSRDPLSRMVHGLTQHKQKKARGDPIMSSEKSVFLFLSRMALDILSVQASSVASESAFSTSGRILSIRRTRLTAESLEMYAYSSDGYFEEPPRDYMLSSGAEDDETQDGAGGSMSHGHGQYTYY
ncbi:zinc finger BED domain-containing protein RICESLEEPER 2 [Tanacetum coccineum]|uniref:Zinc finger BED domain-containing protein RICESLEEPER 2 n=1 Tax=Tanacetum coccineum TaxID=301880 RepID=A0ABQ4YT44_9ASTR